MKAFKTAHDLIRVSGEGAKDFLQGQLSADMDNLEYESGADGAFKYASSLILHPEGKLSAAVRVMRMSEGQLGTFWDSGNGKSREYVLEVTAGFGKEVLARLQRFSIGANCEIISGRCSGIKLVWKTKNQKEPLILDSQNPDRVLEAVYPIMQDYWTDEIACLQMLGAESELKILCRGEGSEEEVEEVPFSGEEELEYLRIACGIPEMGRELTEGMIPALAGKRFIDENVSFTKGCFVGQELVARMDSRGAEPPQKLIGVKIFPGDSDLGDLNSTESEEIKSYGPLMVDEQEVANLTSLAGVSACPENMYEGMAELDSKILAIGLARAKRLLDTGAKASIIKKGKSGDESLEVEVCELPLKDVL